MKRTAQLVPSLLIALCAGGTAWAGGSACTGASDASALKASAGKSCPVVSKTSMASAGDRCAVAHTASAGHKTSAGDHCLMKGAQEADAAKCGVHANQAMLSFAVPGAYCDHCASSIQKAAMDLKGVACAHVDLDNHVAYVIAEKGVKRQAIAKAIQSAGFNNKFQGQGSKVEAAFAKAMVASTKDGAFCCAKKDRDKV